MGGSRRRRPEAGRRAGLFGWVRPCFGLRRVFLVAGFCVASFCVAAHPCRGADCNANGVEDFQEIVGGQADDCNSNFIPDACEFAPTFSVGESSWVRLGSTLRDRVVVDLDGDGALDLVTAHDEPGGVRICYGEGNGTFSPGVVLEASPARRVVAVDIDLDGDLDLVATGGVLRNLGARRFGTIPRTPLEDNFEVGDMNGDGLAEVVFIDGFLLNRGDGRLDFEARKGRPELATVARVADSRLRGLADLDVDGDLDLLVSVDSCSSDGVCGVEIFLVINDGGGSFGEASRVCGDCLEVPVVADFDANGRPDLVGLGVERLGLRANQGEGRFERVTPYVFEQDVFFRLEVDWRRAVASQDLDADGRVDFVVAHTVGASRSSQGLLVLWNEGDGRFLEQELPLGPGMALPAAGDIDGDGDADLLGLDLVLGAAVIFRNEGARRWAVVPQNLSTTGNATFLGMGDLDGDGLPDLVTRGAAGLAGYPLEPFFTSDLGALGVQPARRRVGRTGLLPADGVALADFDGDGGLDCATVCTSEAVLRVIYSDPQLPFGRGVPFPAAAPQSFVATGDFDGDAVPDAVVARTGLAEGGITLFSNRRGSLFSNSEVAVAAAVLALAVGDVDGDADTDVVVAHAGQVTLLLNIGDGTFGEPRSLEVHPNPTALALADLNGDQQLDIVAAGGGSRAVAFLFGTGGGAFGGRTLLPEEADLRDILALDLDGDLDVDLAAADASRRCVAVFWNNGTGGFGAPARFSVERTPLAIGAADINSDGRPDLVSANGASLSVVLNQTAPGRSGDSDGNGIPDSCERLFLRGDCDGDGEALPISDAVFLLRFSFSGLQAPPCLAACDLDADGEVVGGVGDALFFLNFAFLGGPRPSEPFPFCGPGEAVDALTGCDNPPASCAPSSGS